MLLPPVMLLLMTVVILRSPGVSRRAVCGAALMLGGGIGNLIDRLFSGAIVDFVNLGIGSLRTAV